MVSNHDGDWTGRREAGLFRNGAYGLLAPEVGTVVRDVLARRDPQLDQRLARGADLSEQEVDEVQWLLYDEFLGQLGDDWEPTAYGKAVDNALGFIRDEVPHRT